MKKIECVKIKGKEILQMWERENKVTHMLFIEGAGWVGIDHLVYERLKDRFIALDEVILE